MQDQACAPEVLMGLASVLDRSEEAEGSKMFLIPAPVA
jgi:hypothetical protein